MFLYDPPSDPLTIIHQDDDVILVDKLAGLLSVPGKAPEHADCVEARLKALIPDSLLVHRLDMDTSGVMIFARNKNAQRHLGLQFEKRQIKKRYIAIVDGLIHDNTGTIDLPLIVDWPNRPLQKICYETGKKAVTDWQVISRDNGTTRVELRPHTGRSHQLRVHMASLGHPIIGDRFYNFNLSNNPSNRMKLHSLSLSFRHPQGGAWTEFQKKPNF